MDPLIVLVKGDIMAFLFISKIFYFGSYIKEFLNFLLFYLNEITFIGIF